MVALGFFEPDPEIFENSSNVQLQEIILLPLPLWHNFQVLASFYKLFPYVPKLKWSEEEDGEQYIDNAYDGKIQVCKLMRGNEWIINHVACGLHTVELLA